MPRYDAVFIDLDETLMDFRRAGHDALFASFTEVGLEPTEDWYNEYYSTNGELWREVEAGIITVTALRVERFRRYFARLGLALDPAVFSADYEQRIRAVSYHLDGAIEAMREIAKLSKIVIITNGISHVQRARINRSPIAQSIRGMVVSEEAGVSKPDSEIYQLATRFVDSSDKSRMIMIGDSLVSDIAGGIKFGIDTCWYNPAGLPATGGIIPSHTVAHLAELPALVRG